METVRALFAQAHTAHPSNTRALTAWAGTEARASNATGATALLQKATRVQGHFRGGCRDASVFATLGEVLWREEKDAKKARDAFRRAISVDAALARSYQSWAKMEADLGEAPRARELLQQGIWGCSSGVPDRASVAKLWLASAALEASEALEPLRPSEDSLRLAEAARRAFRSALEDASCEQSLAAHCVTTWATFEVAFGERDRARALLEDRLKASPLEVSLWRALLGGHLGCAAVAWCRV